MSHISPSQEEFLKSLLLSACENHQQGNIQKAKELYLQVLESADNPLVRYNLGLIYMDEADFSHAQKCFCAAETLSPEDPDIIFNLALSQKQGGQPLKAVDTYARLLKSDPSHLDALYNLAGCYREIGSYEQAVKCYDGVLSIEPKHEPAMNNIAYSHHILGNKKEALRYYRLLLEQNPEHQGASHMLASLEGRTVERPPEGYLREVFDHYSDYYEQSLVEKLQYSVPTKIRNILDGTPGIPEFFENGIDLGCGTGLSGESFADRIRELSGIDLSPKMLEAAKEKEIYVHLHAGNILDVLLESTDRYDFFLAVDVLIYLGKLDDIFEAINQNGKPGAIFCFSTETSEAEDYVLRTTGRFAHAPVYIRSLADRAGWVELSHQESNLRKEAGEWIAGDLWIFRMP